MSGLSFDVLKWLNSGDLQRLPRNLRHMLATGHVVAELINKYHRDACQPENLAPGGVVRERKENWEYLTKTLARLDFPFTNQWSRQVSAIVTDAGDAQVAAVAILTRLYEFLTKKTARGPVHCDTTPHETPRPEFPRVTRGPPIVLKAPTARNVSEVGRERQRQYMAHFSMQIAGFADTAQAALAQLSKSFADMTDERFLELVAENFQASRLQPLAYSVTGPHLSRLYAKKRYSKLPEEAALLPDLSLDVILGDETIMLDALRTIFHCEYLHLLEQKIPLLVDAACLSLESELFLIFSFCSSYYSTLSTAIFSALQSFVSQLFRSLLLQLKEENLLSTHFLDVIVFYLFVYLPRDIFGVSPTKSYTRLLDPCNAYLTHDSIYGSLDNFDPIPQSYFHLPCSSAYLVSPTPTYGNIYPDAYAHSVESLGRMEFVAHCYSVLLLIFPREGLIYLDNYFFGGQDFMFFAVPSCSSRGYLESQIQDATEEYDIVKPISSRRLVTSLTQTQLTFFLTILKSLGHIELSPATLSFEDLLNLLEYFSFFASQAFIYNTNNVRPNTHMISRTCAVTRDSEGICVQMWAETCEIVVSYLSQMTELRTTDFEELLLACDNASRHNLLSVLARSVQNMQRVLTGLSVKQIRRLGGQASAQPQAQSTRSASRSGGRDRDRVITVMSRRSGAPATGFSFMRREQPPPRREPPLHALATQATAGLHRAVHNFAAHETIFTLKSFLRAVTSLLLSAYKATDLLVDMCLQIYLSQEQRSPIVRSPLPFGSRRARAALQTSRSTNRPASRSMNAITGPELNIGSLDELLKMIERGTTEHAVIQSLHCFVDDAGFLMSECASMVLMLENELMACRNSALFTSTIDIDMNDISNVSILEPHRRILDAFLTQTKTIKYKMEGAFEGGRSQSMLFDRLSLNSPSRPMRSEHRKSRGLSDPGLGRSRTPQTALTDAVPDVSDHVFEELGANIDMHVESESD